MSVVKETPEKENPAIVEVIDNAITALKAGDIGAHWKSEVIDAARQLLKDDKAVFQRKRIELKKADKDSLITEWMKEVTGGDGGNQSSNISKQLVELVKSYAELFHSPDGECYASIEQDGHYETWSLNSKGFSDWIGYRAYKELGFTPTDNGMKTALATLRGIATHDGDEENVYLRCAPYKNGYLIDLTNDEWQAVGITAKGWVVISKPPVKFIRSQNTLPLPMPTKVDGNLELFWKYVNVPKEIRTLILGFILDSWRPDTPYPVAFFTGEEGSGKSSTHTAIRQISDPNTVPLRAAPTNRENIFVSAGVNHQVSFENMSHLTVGQQDAICSLATGGGFAKRKLYTDSDESVIEVKRPVIINGIADVVTRPDLIDRMIHIEVPQLKKVADERKFQTDYDNDRPAIFVGLLDLFVKVLELLPNIQVRGNTRMIGFATLGEAIHKALGIKQSFFQIHQNNRNGSLARSLESSPVAMSVLEMMIKRDGQQWSGTFKALKSMLEQDHHQYGEAWVKSARGLSDMLRRTKRALRSMGIIVEFLGRKRDGSHVKISACEGFKDWGINESSGGGLSDAGGIDNEHNYFHKDKGKVDRDFSGLVH